MQHHHRDIFSHQKKRKKWPYVLLVIAVLVGYAGFAAYRFLQNFSPQEFVKSEVVQDVIVSQIGEEYREVVKLAPQLLGFQEPKTYLVLFLNNTEMRPGGGFIGSYATIRISQGKVEVLKLEGTETIDNAANKTKLLPPPAILQEQLGVDRWYFRDSNWDPDFAKSAERALDFYLREDGVAAGEIDAVIAITPTVLEAVLTRIGPITVDGLSFNGENVTETLEYEVEYGYEDRGIRFENRKAIMKPFFLAILDRVQNDIFTNPIAYLEMTKSLIEQKHIMAYSTDPGLASIIQEFDADGTIRQTTSDYLMWNDANLAALKTDHALDRYFQYSVEPLPDGRYLAMAELLYDHTGGFDWRTTRYRSNTKLYVPEGAVLLEASVLDENRLATPIDAKTTRAFGKEVFEAFHVIEPGKKGGLSFVYELPPRIAADIKTGTYTLDVQKQLGLPDLQLQLNIDFDRAVQSASPAEPQDRWGDDSYFHRTPLLTDRQFQVGF